MRILHPTDFSEASNKALAVARMLRDLLGGELVLLHAIEYPVRSKVYGDYWDEMLSKTFEERRRELIAYLTEKLKELEPNAKHVIDEGKPLSVILKHAKEADLVAMGTHGPEGLLDHGCTKTGRPARSSTSRVTEPRKRASLARPMKTASAPSSLTKEQSTSTGSPSRITGTAP